MITNWLTALKLLYISEFGTCNELQRLIDKKVIDSFANAGFISYGYTLKAKTWKLAKFGREFLSMFVDNIKI